MKEFYTDTFVKHTKEVADWWLEKLRQAIAEERESVKKMVEAWKQKYDSYQTMMSTQTNFKKGEMARELSDDLISHLTQE